MSLSEAYPPRSQHAPSFSNHNEDASAQVGLLQDEEATSSADERLGAAPKRVDSPDEDDDEERTGAGGMTPLDETLELIGMGRYQKTLL
jgi:hypothetical protein